MLLTAVSSPGWRRAQGAASQSLVPAWLVSSPLLGLQKGEYSFSPPPPHHSPRQAPKQPAAHRSVLTGTETCARAVPTFHLHRGQRRIQNSSREEENFPHVVPWVGISQWHPGLSMAMSPQGSGIPALPGCPRSADSQAPGMLAAGEHLVHPRECARARTQLRLPLRVCRDPWTLGWDTKLRDMWALPGFRAVGVADH